MENRDLVDSFSEFKDEKDIERVTLMAILEDVFRNALKKDLVMMITLISLLTQIKEIARYSETV